MEEEEEIAENETNQNQTEDDVDLHHVDSDDLLLPWSCCVSEFLKLEEEKESTLNEPEALANTIRHRLMAKNQVYMIIIIMIHIQGRRNGLCLGGSEYYERGWADRNPRIYFIKPQF